MGRPKSDDPKVAVTLRLPRSVVAQYQEDGAGWRAKMEEVLLLAHPLWPASVKARPASAPKLHINRLKGVWKAP